MSGTLASVLLARRFVFQVSSTKRVLFMVSLALCAAVAEALSIGAVLPFLTLLSSRGEDLPHWMILFGDVFGLADSIEHLRILFGVVFISAVLLSGSLRLALLYVQVSYSHRLCHELCALLFSRYLRSELSYLSRYSTSELIAMTGSKVGMATFSVVMPFLLLSASVASMCFIVGMLLLVDFQSTMIVGGLVLAVYIVVTLFVKSSVQQSGITVNEYAAKLIKLQQDAFASFREIALLNLRDDVAREFKASDLRMKHAMGYTSFVTSSPRLLIETFGVAALAVGGLLIVSTRGDISGHIAMFAMYAFALQRLLPLAQSVYQGILTLSVGAPAVRDVTAELATKPIVAVIASSAPVAEVEDSTSISVVAVSFSYESNQRTVFNDFTLNLKRGEVVGLTGRSGAGKSTIVDIVCGLRSPDTGRVLLDSHLIDTANRTILQSLCFVVPQNVFLSDGSFYENIALGVKPQHVDRARVAWACEQACLVDDIRQMSDGLDTLLQEGGRRLSVGQRQRVGIARAVYFQRPFLILDEATNGLDELVEKEILSNLRAMLSTWAILIVSHKRTTLSFCDRLVSVETSSDVSV